MIVITGATGLVGRPLVDALAGHRVRAVTRTPRNATFPSHVEVFEGDSAEPATIAEALRGATSLFINPRAVGDSVYELVDLARESGVRRVVALAAANVEDDFATQPSRFRGDRNREAEDAVVNSGLDWVSLRPSTFAVNALYAWGDQIRSGDVVRFVHAGFHESPIHERDLAEVAARALTTDDLLGRRVVLTGPESLSHAEMVDVIGDVLSRPLRFEEIPAGVAQKGMLDKGFPEPMVRALMARYAANLARPQFPPTHEVEKILGRPARTFASWVEEHAAEFGAD